MREEKLFRSARRFIGRRRGFSTIFSEFSTIFRNFLQFFGIFCNFFGKFSQKFLQFFSTFAIFLRFFRKFFRKFSHTIRYGSTGVPPYCKFTSKFTPKFTLILIKILQSTKFEGSHFHNLLQFLIHFHNSLSPLGTF